MKHDKLFVPGCHYHTRGSYRHDFYLYVDQIALSGRALRGLVYDRSFGIMARRWFAIRNGVCITSRSDVYFTPDKEIFTDSACFPPSEVLEWFRFELARGSSK